jgi:hypothetical protein
MYICEVLRKESNNKLKINIMFKGLVKIIKTVRFENGSARQFTVNGVNVIIDDAGKGRGFDTFFRTSKKKIHDPKRFLILAGKKSVSAHEVKSGLFHLHRLGALNLFVFGFNSCGKCGGTGNIGCQTDAGTCWKCNGIGLTK